MEGPDEHFGITAFSVVLQVNSSYYLMSVYLTLY